MVFWLISGFASAQYIMNKHELAPPTLWPESQEQHTLHTNISFLSAEIIKWLSTIYHVSSVSFLPTLTVDKESSCLTKLYSIGTTHRKVSCYHLPPQTQRQLPALQKLLCVSELTGLWECASRNMFALVKYQNNSICLSHFFHIQTPLILLLMGIYAFLPVYLLLLLFIWYCIYTLSYILA